jgi:hypothetical protein
MSSSPFQPVLEVDLSQQSGGDPGSPTPSPKVHDISDVPLEEPASPDPFLPPTLETRKKKKKAEPVLLDKDNTSSQVHGTSNNKTAQPRKSGSKRKFYPDEDGTLSDGVAEGDDFQFSRPSQSPQKYKEPLDLGKQDLSPTKTPVSIIRGSATGTAKRKVLEPSMTAPSTSRSKFKFSFCMPLDTDGFDQQRVRI